MSNKFCFRVRSPELVAVAPGTAARRARAAAEEGHVAHVPAAVPVAGLLLVLQKRSIRRFVITEKAPTRAFSRGKAATIAFTFKTLLRHYANLPIPYDLTSASQFYVYLLWVNVCLA